MRLQTLCLAVQKNDKIAPKVKNGKCKQIKQEIKTVIDPWMLSGAWQIKYSVKKVPLLTTNHGHEVGWVEN